MAFRSASKLRHRSVGGLFVGRPLRGGIVVRIPSGALHKISAVCMKHPPEQFRDSEARERLERWIAGQ